MLKSIKRNQKVDPLLLSEFIVFKFGPMSHLKLQKLLYYVQGYHLAYFETPLFNEDFEAWVHGPVCREVFNKVKEHSLLYNDLQFILESGDTPPDKKISEQLSADQLDLINDVLTEYKDLTGLELENLTHQESPWLEARDGYDIGERCSQTISKQTMQEYFKTQLDGTT
jgi:uncharacterized phage-associated protein